MIFLFPSFLFIRLIMNKTVKNFDESITFKYYALATAIPLTAALVYIKHAPSLSVFERYCAYGGAAFIGNALYNNMKKKYVSRKTDETYNTLTDTNQRKHLLIVSESHKNELMSNYMLNAFSFACAHGIYTYQTNSVPAMQTIIRTGMTSVGLCVGVPLVACLGGIGLYSYMLNRG